MLPKFSSKAFLAPMAGVSDPALRLQCKKMGAGLVVTEFTSIHSIVAKEKQLKEHMQSITEFIEYSEQERPLSVQLFGSDLDAATLNVIEKGRRNVEILKQAQNDPFTVEDQVAIIYAGSKNLLRDVPVAKVKEFERDYIELLNAQHRGMLDTLKSGKLTVKDMKSGEQSKWSISEIITKLS